MSKSEQGLREELVSQCRWLNSNNFNQGTVGNISVRLERTFEEADLQRRYTDVLGIQTINETSTTGSPPASSEVQSKLALLITPSCQDYAGLKADMLVKMAGDGSWQGDFQPSSEWRFHVDILMARPEIKAVVHTHSMFATIQSMTRQAIPACHYLIANLGGSEIRCAPYARFGSQQLSDHAVSALDGRMACLLANHGAIALGRTLKQAIDHAVLLETLAQQYYFAKIAGVCLLTDREIAETRVALEQLPRA